MMKKDKSLLYAGGFAGVIASLCCVGPAVIVLFGLGSVSTALTIGKYTWLFTTLALLFFGGAAFLYLKKNKCCNVEGVKKNWKVIIISFILLVILLISLKYWLAPWLAKIVYR